MNDDHSSTTLLRIRRFLPLLALVSLIAGFAFRAGGYPGLSGPTVILSFGLLALFVGSSPRFSAFAFTLWVAVFVSAALFYPLAFRSWYGFELKNLIVPLIQIIMFGMGTQLTVADFLRVFTMPKGVFVGFALQFSVMPIVGKTLSLLFVSNPEVAAGIVLVGTCPSGVASNVMNYLAHGNVALSVTVTAFTTLAAPLITPALTSLLAGTYVDVSLGEMMKAILNMIVVPVVGGLAVNWLLTRLGRTHPSMERLSTGIMKGLPLLSMVSICFIIAIITSLSRDALLGGFFVLSILAAVVIHNVAGYVLGYWASRAVGLNRVDSRTIAIEVGLQNAGMASGLAITVLKSELAAIPPAIFGPVMNMSGASLASWWAARPVRRDADAPNPR